ncbi:cytidine deaminase [Affinibrenneria salicis]|uniref:Cytidine deaminase n=1 Tax=Affinibrenneria salicis TaxID=2590031 RepID=A0A5J5G3G1_9GAMM|nr:cytidine deaminase [Affinibrenneria salicis]KAA9000573.1 cytidine deaminase [Affinibrenneria salicis]
MHPRFQSAFEQLPAALRSALAPMLHAASFTAAFSAGQVDLLCQASGLQREALAFSLLPLAAACALAPISAFQVGAIAHGRSGNIYFGANMEFSGAPLQQTVHAEQSAITHAWLQNEKQLIAVTVNYTPCGHCRQFMNELRGAGQLHIHLPGRPAALLGHYLPDAFGPGDLAIDTLLMDEVQHAYRLADDDGAPLAQAALTAACRSHAPYSGAHSGVALEDRQGNIYCGRYAENAAFNPSLPPLQAALILMNMRQGDLSAIRRAVLVEQADAALTQWPATRDTLRALGCEQVERRLINKQI